MDYDLHMPRANRHSVPGYACHLTHRCHNRECVAVGSEGFVRSVEFRIQGRQQMEVVGHGDRWMLRETGAGYDARRGATGG